MRELFLKSIAVEDGQGGTHTFDYAVIVNEMDVGAFACESYGLQIRERESGTVSRVPHITTSVSRIDALCERVLAGAVTPLSLEDVVRDWL